MKNIPNNLKYLIIQTHKDQMHKELIKLIAEYATGMKCRSVCVEPKFVPSNKADDVVWRGDVLASMINAPHNVNSPL